jgi:tRNA threonylcarbamoyladenosine biosynthesis protein TsaE
MLIVCERDVDLGRLHQIGRALAAALGPGDLVLLYGPLGAGKTTLVRIIAAALGVTDVVRSPSFTIANIYSGPIAVQHLDLYRLADDSEEDALALEEYHAADSVTLVEWPEAGLARLGTPDWVIRMEHETLHTRAMEVEAVSARASERWAESRRDARGIGPRDEGGAS